MASSIRAAVIGLTDPVWNILVGLQGTSGLKLVGLADADKERVADCVESTGLAGYDDHRIMLLETRPGIIFITT